VQLLLIGSAGARRGCQKENPGANVDASPVFRAIPDGYWRGCQRLGRGGHRVRITAQLIYAASGRHLWADRYDRVLNLPPDRPMPNFAPSWNLTPTDPIPIVRRNPDDGLRRPRRGAPGPDLLLSRRRDDRLLDLHTRLLIAPGVTIAIPEVKSNSTAMRAGTVNGRSLHIGFP
jgi:hypothetical protein